jgi:septum formation inhibitor-activating ATPase MinD
VTRLKKNVVYKVIEVLKKHQNQKKAMVLLEEIIELEYYPENEQGKRQIKDKKTLPIKKVCYQDEQGRYYEFISNSMDKQCGRNCIFV